MTKKKKIYKAELICIDVKCLDCGNTFNILNEKINFNSSSSPCDVCGSHGNIQANVECPYCKTSKTIDLYEW